jgi:hypothetical protein
MPLGFGNTALARDVSYLSLDWPNGWLSVYAVLRVAGEISSSMALSVGLKVESLFDDLINWYPAEVSKINQDGTFGIR